jgi:cell wall-associated NlpC family hydrolase
LKYKLKYLVYLVMVMAVFLIPSSVFADYGDTTLKKGMSHADVIELQKKLHELGFFTEVEYTNGFGSKTEEAVIKFQKSVGVTPDGVAGQQTLNAIDIKIRQKKLIPENFTQLASGDSGELVKTIQQRLQSMKLYDGEMTSLYDDATKEAVAKFQASNSLEATGIVDKATLIKINTASASINRGAARLDFGNTIINYAKKFIGTPYKWGGASGSSFDCSGFVLYVFKHFDIMLGHGADDQFDKGANVQKPDLLPGDTVFFATYKKTASHVGIYVGNNKFIHASSGGGEVMISSLDEDYYKNRYLGARRFE